MSVNHDGEQKEIIFDRETGFSESIESQLTPVSSLGQSTCWSHYVGHVCHLLILSEAGLFEQQAVSHQHTYIRTEWRPSKDKQ